MKNLWLIVVGFILIGIATIFTFIDSKKRKESMSVIVLIVMMFAILAFSFGSNGWYSTKVWKVSKKIITKEIDGKFNTDTLIMIKAK